MRKYAIIKGEYININFSSDIKLKKKINLSGFRLRNIREESRKSNCM